MNTGNPTTWRGVTSLTYDGASRLLTYNTLLTAKYRGDGLRGWKQQGANTSTRTYFLYDGTEPVVELDSAGNAKAYNTFGAYGLVSRTTVSTGASVFYLFDANGNVAHRLNSSEAVLSSDVYDCYGNQKQGNTTDPFGYEGQYGYYRDSETGLYLCTFRYYDPVSARFVTRDPIGYNGGINLYGYTGGNPVNLVDPSGLVSVPFPTPATANLSNNAKEASCHFGNPFWFRKMVQKGGPWDYKGPYDKNDKPMNPQFAKFGNYNYGYTGAAIGIPLPFLLNEAGNAQGVDYPNKKEHGSPGPNHMPWKGTPPYGDKELSQRLIKEGYNQYLKEHQFDFSPF